MRKVEFVVQICTYNIVISLGPYDWYSKVKCDLQRSLKTQSIWMQVGELEYKFTTYVTTLVVCAYVCGLLNEYAQVGETHYSDRLVFCMYQVLFNTASILQRFTAQNGSNIRPYKSRGRASTA